MADNTIITLDNVLEQLRGIADKTIVVESARVEPNYVHCTTGTGWYFRFFNESEGLDYIEAIEVAPSETWYHGPSPILSALDQLGAIGTPLRDVLYEAAGATIPSGPPIGVHTHATEIHPLPWTVDPIDAGDVTKYEINDANNFVVCLLDDEVVAQFIVDRINSVDE
jgi:hypothetical protein